MSKDRASWRKLANKCELLARWWRRLQGHEIEVEKKLSRDATVSLSVHFIFAIGVSMSGVFLNVYLWRLGNSIAINGYFQIIHFIVTSMGFIVGGWFVKKYDRILIYRIGIAMVGLFFFCVIVAQEQVLAYYAVFAVFHGLAMAFYWSSYVTLMYDVSNEHNRIRFLAFNMTVFTLGTLSGPVIAGYLIHRMQSLVGYTLEVAIATVMFVIAAIISFKVPSLQLPKKPLYIKQTWKLIRKHIVWQKALVAFTIIGLYQGLMLLLPNILVYRYVPREDWIGYLGMMYSSTTILMSMWISRKAQPENARTYVIAAACLVTLGSLIYWIHMGLVTLIVFMLLYSMSTPLQWNALTTRYFGMVSKLPLRGNLRVESVILREGALNVGRVISIFVMLIVASDLQSRQLSVLFVVISLLQFVIVWFMSKPSDSKV